MAKKHEQDLRIVEGVVSAQLAKHDAEIAALRAQVAELEAWKAAVPVKSILWYFDVSEFSQAIVNYNTVTQMKHNTALEKWHRDMVEEVIDV